MSPTSLRSIALAAAAALSLVAVPTSAGQSQAKPEPCDGKLLIKDAAGDQGATVQGVPAFETPPSTDILGLFFRVDGDKVTANIVVSDLVASPPAGFYAVRYRAYATVAGDIQYFQALVTSSGTTYTYGGDFAGVSYAEQGDTTGALFEGKDGVIQLVLPPDVGGKPGTPLAATSATAGPITAPVPPQAMLAPFYFQADTAPDGAADGPGTTPAPCAAATTTSPGGPAATTPKVTLKKSSLSAKKTNSKRSATFSLSSSEELTSVTGKLRRGSTILGSGKLSKLSGTAPLKVKLKQKVKKGNYTLALTAKTAGGSAFSSTFKVKFGS
jgi:hypothetical protein